MKRCAKCNVLKDEEQFYTDRKNKDGKTYYCRTCLKLSKREWKAAKREAATKKECTSCNEEKPLKDFYSNKNFKDGKTYYCKSCLKNNSREYNGVVSMYSSQRKAPDNLFIPSEERRLNMREIFRYDDDYNLLAIYDNVLEAVSKESGISSADIYKTCLKGRRRLKGDRWSFNQILSNEMTLQILEWIEQEM